MQTREPKEKSREGTGLSGPHRVNDFGNYAYARITTRCVDKGDNSRILARCDIGATPDTTPGLRLIHASSLGASRPRFSSI